MNHKLTEESKVSKFSGKTLFRIEATANIKWAKKGEKGGWVEKIENVSGDAWVYGDAEVSGKLKLSLGYFFGMRYKKEDIKYHKLDDDYEIIYKGEAKID